MNSDEQQIEAMLRTAPHPQPPHGLKEQLLRQARSTGRGFEKASITSNRGPWLRRWWPALLPATLSFACAAVIVVQHQEIQQLEQSVQKLQTESAAASASQNDSPAPNVSSPDSAAAQEQEIARLKEQVSALTAEISGLEKLRMDNQNLRSQLAAPAASGLTADETAGLAAARERAMRFACVNNMKQLGLAARVWAGDNNDFYPSNVVCMSNEIYSTKTLICPADTSHQLAPDFQSYTDANCSYEWYLKPTGKDDEPTRVLTRCPIHGSVGLYDGSVQSFETNTNRAGDFVTRDGKLYYEPRGTSWR
jgi:hypothetical protein